MRRLAVSILAFVLLQGSFFFESLFAPSADLWPRWQAHDPDSTARIIHADWDNILDTYLRRGPDGIARFAYSRMAAVDKRRLDDYVTALSAVPVSRYRRAEQLAYWINLYNALTVQIVATRIPVDSIRDIDLGAGDGPWDRKLLKVEGEELSLNDIEHRILRPIWRDPRLHYALNCASLGCPDLASRAYTGDGVNHALEAAARNFVNHPRGVSIEGGKLVVSSLYVWFEEDFGGSDRAVIAHLRRYAGPTLAERLAGFAEIDDHRYDWALNDTDRPPGG